MYVGDQRFGLTYDEWFLAKSIRNRWKKIKNNKSFVYRQVPQGLSNPSSSTSSSYVCMCGFYIHLEIKNKQRYKLPAHSIFITHYFKFWARSPLTSLLFSFYLYT